MIPDAGDILHLNFDPASGKEMKGPHFCLVVSPQAFNQTFQLAWTVPITTGAQNQARGLTAISLMGAGTQTSGNIIAHQIKALDWRARQASHVEKVPSTILNQVLDVCLAILDPKNR